MFPYPRVTSVYVPSLVGIGAVLDLATHSLNVQVEGTSGCTSCFYRPGRGSRSSRESRPLANVAQGYCVLKS